MCSQTSGLQLLSLTCSQLLLVCRCDLSVNRCVALLYRSLYYRSLAGQCTTIQLRNAKCVPLSIRYRPRLSGPSAGSFRIFLHEIAALNRCERSRLACLCTLMVPASMMQARQRLNRHTRGSENGKRVLPRIHFPRNLRRAVHGRGPDTRQVCPAVCLHRWPRRRAGRPLADL